jgi:hypothetical protein
MSRLSPFHYAIALGVIVGFIRLNRLERLLKSLPFFLLLTLFVECATPLHLIHFHGNNSWWFNIFTTLEFLYYSFVFYHLLQSKSLKKTVILITAVILIFACINIFLIQGFYNFHTHSYRVGALMVVTWCLLYFRHLMQSSDHIDLAKDPFFWMCTGLLFFYLVFFCYWSAFDNFLKMGFDKIDQELWDILRGPLNFLLYSCFVIALLCPRKSRLSYK